MASDHCIGLGIGCIELKHGSRARLYRLRANDDLSCQAMAALEADQNVKVMAYSAWHSISTT